MSELLVRQGGSEPVSHEGLQRQQIHSRGHRSNLASSWESRDGDASSEDGLVLDQLELCVEADAFFFKQLQVGLMDDEQFRVCFDG